MATPSLTGLPIVVQEVELAAARLPDYTLPELVDAPGLTYEKAAGDVEVFPGVTVIPTPGHTDGHQSVVVRPGRRQCHRARRAVPRRPR